MRKQSAVACDWYGVLRDCLCVATGPRSSAGTHLTACSAAATQPSLLRGKHTQNSAVGDLWFVSERFACDVQRETFRLPRWVRRPDPFRLVASRHAYPRGGATHAEVSLRTVSRHANPPLPVIPRPFLTGRLGLQHGRAFHHRAHVEPASQQRGGCWRCRCCWWRREGGGLARERGQRGDLRVALRAGFSSRELTDGWWFRRC